MILRSLLCTAFFQFISMVAVQADVSVKNRHNSTDFQEISSPDEGGISVEMQDELRRREQVRRQLEALEQAELENEISQKQQMQIQFQQVSVTSDKPATPNRERKDTKAKTDPASLGQATSNN